MKKFLLIIAITLFSALFVNGSQAALNWGAGGPTFVQYLTITGHTGFITTPSAYCAPMGTLSIGYEHTFSTNATYGAMASILKLTFTPHHMFEFGFSKELAYEDRPSGQSQFYFDSTPFFFHMKLRFLDWRDGAVAFGLDIDITPDMSGTSSRGGMSITPYFVFTGVTTLLGAFNFGFGKTFYLDKAPDMLINFFASWVYSFAQLDHRLQLVIDFSNADYRAGDSRFKAASEDRAYLNFQIRGVVVKTPIVQWTIMATLYDMFDLGGRPPVYVTFNASIGTSLHIKLY